MKIYNIVEIYIYANGNININKVLSYNEKEKAKEYINELIKDTDEIIDYEENKYITYEEDYGKTIYVELVKSNLK